MKLFAGANPSFQGCDNKPTPPMVENGWHTLDYVGIPGVTLDLFSPSCYTYRYGGTKIMSQEFDDLKKAAERGEKKNLVTRKERYQYARSLGFPFAMARWLQGSSKERILRLSKELKR